MSCAQSFYVSSRVYGLLILSVIKVMRNYQIDAARVECKKLTIIVERSQKAQSTAIVIYASASLSSITSFDFIDKP